MCVYAGRVYSCVGGGTSYTSIRHLCNSISVFRVGVVLANWRKKQTCNQISYTSKKLCRLGLSDLLMVIQEVCGTTENWT